MTAKDPSSDLRSELNYWKTLLEGNNSVEIQLMFLISHIHLYLLREAGLLGFGYDVMTGTS